MRTDQQNVIDYNTMNYAEYAGDRSLLLGNAGWSTSVDECHYHNAGTCPDCGVGMVRQGVCLVCPSCGYGSCG